MVRLLLSAMLLVGLGCGDDGATPGLRDECSSFSGAGLECESPPIESAADACQKLVDCGVIPLDAEGAFDWAECMARLEGLDDYNRELVFACVEVSSCDELKTPGSPDSPGQPLCLEHGDL